MTTEIIITNTRGTPLARLSPTEQVVACPKDSDPVETGADVRVAKDGRTAQVAYLRAGSDEDGAANLPVVALSTVQPGTAVYFCAGRRWDRGVVTT